MLALIASGLTIIYGTLGVSNLAHGAMFMLGGYAGYVAFEATGSFVIAVIAGALFLAVVGGVMELVVIRRFYSRPPEDQILVTFGIGIVIVEAVRFFFGSLSQTIPPPSWAAGITPLGFMIYPTYRIVALASPRPRSRCSTSSSTARGSASSSARGSRIPRWSTSLGINVYRVFMLVFGIGAMAAGFAGIVNAPVVSLDPRHGRVDPGADLCRRRHRRGRLVSRRHPRRPDRRGNPQPDLDGRPELLEVMLFVVMTLVLLLRPSGPARHRGPRLSVTF